MKLFIVLLMSPTILEVETSL